MGLRSTPRNAAATWRMLLQLQKHLQTEKLAPYGTAVRTHVTQKLGQISKIWSIQNLDIVP